MGGPRDKRPERLRDIGRAEVAMRLSWLPSFLILFILLIFTYSNTLIALNCYN